MKQPEPPEPWLDGIDVVVLPRPSRYFEGCFAPGDAGLISALEERRIAETSRTHLTVDRMRPDSSDIEWLDFRGPTDDLDPALRRWIGSESISACL
jgi:hypothetical protein